MDFNISNNFFPPVLQLTIWWAQMGQFGPKKGAKMVSANTIFDNFDFIFASMVVEMAQKPLSYEEQNIFQVVNTKNGQKHPILGLIDVGGTLKP